MIYCTFLKPSGEVFIGVGLTDQDLAEILNGQQHHLKAGSLQTVVHIMEAEQLVEVVGKRFGLAEAADLRDELRGKTGAEEDPDPH